MSAASSNPVRVFHGPSAAKVLAGFLLSGFLFALLGALLPAWGYHLGGDFNTVGNYFLGLAGGVIAAALLSRVILKRIGLGVFLLLACTLACLTLVYLAGVGPPVEARWRLAGLVLLGLATGLLNAGLFHAISPAFRGDPATAVIGGGVFFGIGCVAAVMLVSGTFYVYSVRGILLLVAAVPAAFAVWYALSRWPAPVLANPPSMTEALQDFRSPPAVLLALLLFFQFGNEWSLAGWLPLFLIRRVGMSPESSLMLTAFYWLALLLGRLAALLLLPVVRHHRLLLGSALAAQFGCLVLTFTNNRFGAVAGILFTGTGFATIYPLVAEKIGRRFSYYQPGLSNGIFSIGLMGGLLAPASIGYLAEAAGIRVAMGVPFLGAAMVSLLILLIWLEARITG